MDKLFDTEYVQKSNDEILEIRIEDIKSFSNHPFKAIMNNDTIKLSENIKTYDVLSLYQGWLIRQNI